MRMHLKWPIAQQYLIDNDQDMGESTWYRWKKRLASESQHRLYEVVQYELPEQHMEALDEIKAARKRLWENVQKIKDPVKQNLMIINIINTLPLRSSYYDSTKGVIEKPVESQEDNSIQESGTTEPATDWV